MSGESGFDVLAALAAAGSTVSVGRGKLRAAVDREDALVHAGYTGQKIDDELRQRLEDAARSCEEDNQVLYTWRIEDIDGSRRFGELVRFGPLRVRALVLDRWPRTGRPRRCRRPR